MPLPDLIDVLMPHFDVDEVHRRHISASPEQVMAAVRDVTVGEVRLLGPLMAVRMLPMRAAGRADARLAPSRPFLQELLDGGFFTLGERAGRELVLGEVGQPWRVTTTPSRLVTGPEEFAAFATSGFVKVAVNFMAVPHASGSILTTQTRILATDASARRRFGWYWRAIGWGSALIRRSWLAAIARRAQLSAVSELEG